MNSLIIRLYNEGDESIRWYEMFTDEKTLVALNIDYVKTDRAMDFISFIESKGIKVSEFHGNLDINLMNKDFETTGGL